MSQAHPETGVHNLLEQSDFSFILREQAATFLRGYVKCYSRTALLTFGLAALTSESVRLLVGMFLNNLWFLYK